jgi:hypothetical protein
MDRFIVVMSRGLIVKRHQAGCIAEEVRIFSDDGCHSICWEPPRVSIIIYGLGKIASAYLIQLIFCYDTEITEVGPW